MEPDLLVLHHLFKARYFRILSRLPAAWSTSRQENLKETV